MLLCANWDLVANTVNKINNTYKILDYGSSNTTTATVNVSTWEIGTYLIACNNATTNTSIRGTSLYLITIRHNLNYLLFTKVAEEADSTGNNSRISNMTISNDVITITYTATGYHTVYAMKF